MWFAVIRLAPDHDLGVVLATNIASPKAMQAITREADALLELFAKKNNQSHTKRENRK